nr:peptide ABC transporter substrate-binding protein [Actinomycetota bacterium]
RQYAEALLKPKPGVLKASELDVQGAAADRYDVSPDGLTYTFHLRRDAKFNDGRPVVAADFLYGWRRVIDPRLTGPLGSVFANAVKGGEKAASLGPSADAATVDAALSELGLNALDDQTFQVTLAQPAPYFKWIATLHQGAPIRKDVVDRAGSDTWATKPETLVTNGPFKVTDIGQNAVTLEANPFYWKKPYLTKIVATYGIDPAPRWAAYLNNELDISNGPPTASYDATLKDPRFKDEVTTFLELSNNWLQFNTAKAPFDNAKVRLAFAQAIDRKAYLGGSSNSGVALASLVPDGIPGFNPSAGAAQDFDPVKAKANLAASGVDARQFDGVKILTAPFQEPDAIIFTDMIKKNLGLTLGVETIGDTATLNSAIAKGDYWLKTTFQGYSALYPDPQDFFDVFLSTSRQNDAKWKNLEYDRLVKQADLSTDPTKRLQLYDQAQKIIVDEAPVAFLAQLNRTFWVKPWVKGIDRTPVDTAFMPGDFSTTTMWIAKH